MIKVPTALIFHIHWQCLWLVLREAVCCKAEHKFMIKLCIERCLEWTRLALFLSSSLIHSIMFLFLSMILSHIAISLFFILALSPWTSWIPWPNRLSKSSCLMHHPFDPIQIILLENAICAEMIAYQNGHNLTFREPALAVSVAFAIHALLASKRHLIAG